MKVIYVAGPFRAKTSWQVEQNIREAEDLGFEVATLGAVPLIPHTLYRFFNGELTDQFWLDGTMELMRRCDGVIFLPRWVFSSGSKAERAEAERLSLPIFDSLVKLDVWLRRT